MVDIIADTRLALVMVDVITDERFVSSVGIVVVSVDVFITTPDCDPDLEMKNETLLNVVLVLILSKPFMIARARARGGGVFGLCEANV